MVDAYPDPAKYGDSVAVAEEYAELNAEKIETIRGILKTVMLRRTKDLVLDLPPLVSSSSLRMT